MEVEVRKANSGDLGVLVPRVARAFEPQPFTRWLLGEAEDALERGERLIQLEFEKALPYGLTYTTTDRRGAALWHPPEKKLDLLNDLRAAAAIGLGRRTLSQLITGLRLAGDQPKERHYYLAVLGVDPDSQGEGIGSALLEPGLALCDREGLPAYLITDTELNVRFYAAKGFKVRAEVPAYGAAVCLYTMWRTPQV